MIKNKKELKLQSLPAIGPMLATILTVVCLGTGYAQQTHVQPSGTNQSKRVATMRHSSDTTSYSMPKPPTVSQGADSTAAASTATQTTTQVKPTAATAPQVAQPRTWRNAKLFVDPANAASTYAGANPTANGVSYIARIGQQPVAEWFSGWSGAIAPAVNAYVSQAATAYAMPVLVAYNIPNRDCGGYSAGGAQTASDYASWIKQFAAGIGNRPAVVILEPDAVALQDCLSSAQLALRNQELSSAIITLKANPQTKVYLDAGHSNWASTGDMASRLTAAGVANADGISLNVSNFQTTTSNIAYGTQLSVLLGGKHFIIDTSRNGNGPLGSEWCNPVGRALGILPTTQTGNALVDAYLWVKAPWESDGSCNGAPAAGQPNWPYAISLAQNASW